MFIHQKRYAIDVIGHSKGWKVSSYVDNYCLQHAKQVGQGLSFYPVWSKVLPLTLYVRRQQGLKFDDQGPLQDIELQ